MKDLTFAERRRNEKKAREKDQAVVIELLRTHLKNSKSDLAAAIRDMDEYQQRNERQAAEVKRLKIAAEEYAAVMADRAELRAALALLISDKDRGLESSPETWDYARNVLTALRVKT